MDLFTVDLNLPGSDPRTMVSGPSSVAHAEWDMQYQVMKLQRTSRWLGCSLEWRLLSQSVSGVALFHRFKRYWDQPLLLSTSACSTVGVLKGVGRVHSGFSSSTLPPWVALPGVLEFRQHRSQSHWTTQALHHDKERPSEGDITTKTFIIWNKQNSELKV